MNADLAEQVRQQKALARRNESIYAWVLFVGLLCGGIAYAAWFALDPDDGKPPVIWTFVCIAIAVMLAGLPLVKLHARLFPRKAACPVCGHDWEIKQGKFVPVNEQMLAWDHCPGCGLLMNEELFPGRPTAGR